MPYYQVKEGSKIIGYLTPGMSRKARALDKLKGVEATTIDPKTIPEDHVAMYFGGEKPWDKGDKPE